ncbi:MAG: BlaI/MecI/CopY family transcriptional regulator [Verrucomicrobia bacterium]|nr:BlaI/MecI/CopY family transcriptional regulator [Verrucomicrobiota bacterium]
MKKRKKRLQIETTPAELAVLKALWECDPQTIGAIADRIYPNGTVSDYATVQSLIVRLEKKGCIARDRSGKAHRFSARIAREDLLSSQLRTVADKLCGGALAPLVTHLIRGAELTPKELGDLRNLINQMENEPPEK